jgi:hypothetical protein
MIRSTNDRRSNASVLPTEAQSGTPVRQHRAQWKGMRYEYSTRRQQ